jgi:predicted thioesterase/uncharacterized membrane protein YecN with MAPEG domain
MAELVSGLLLVLVAPLVLVTPGYLVLRLLEAHGMPLADGGFEALGVAVTISLALVVLVAYVLAETVGFATGPLAATYAVLVAGLAALAHRVHDRGIWPRRLTPSRSSGSASAGGLSTGAILLGVTLALVAAGAVLYDDTDPYTEAYYANASQVQPTVEVAPGEAVTWTIVVENHEGREVDYALETVRRPNATTNDSRPAQVTVDRGSLAVPDGDQARYEVRLEAPEGGTWKVQTRVHADDGEPISVHRWLVVDG